MLTANNICFGYTRNAIINNISFSLNAGDALQICGHNGAGKSTLLKICAGLLAPNSGKIKLHHPLQSEYLPAENNGLFQFLDAKSNLNFWLSHCKWDVHKVEPTLEKFKLLKAAQAKLPVRFYSSGMKRRLALAIIYACQKKLWILDEPISNLDAEGISLFQEITNNHLANNGSILFVSHTAIPINGLSNLNLNLNLNQA